MPGLDSLLQVKKYHHSLYDQALYGAPIHHGISPLQYRKDQQSQYGHTKKFCDPKHASKHGITHEDNEGSPPPQRRLRRNNPSLLVYDSEESGEYNSIHSESQPSDSLQIDADTHAKAVKQFFDNILPSKDYDRDLTRSVINISQTKELPSFPWSHNSCWLDASLEALYTTLNYGDWLMFESLFAGESQRSTLSPIYYLYIMQKGCHDWPLSDFPGSSAPSQELQNIHDGFCSFLYHIKLVTGSEDSFQDLLIVITLIIDYTDVVALGSSLPMLQNCQKFFSVFTTIVRFCTGSSSGSGSLDHVLINKPHSKTSVYDGPSINEFEICEGSIKTWFNKLTHIKLATTGSQTRSDCWHNVYCSKRCAFDITFITSIPVVLTIEPSSIHGQMHLSEALSNTDHIWDFPHTLTPLTLNDVKDKGLEYILVAQIFKNSDHFITRSAVPTSSGKLAIFEYDGMNHYGYSQLQSGSSMDVLIAGRTPPVPKGYCTYAAIYCLCGGLSAQQYFEAQQQELFKKKLLVDLVNPPNYVATEFQAVPDAECHWTMNQQSTQQPSLPPIAMQGDDGNNVASSPNNDSEEEELFLNKNDAPEDRNKYYLSTARNSMPPVSSSPPPSSPLHILCHCGMDSNGHCTEVKEDTIKCEECHNYSHLACQTYCHTQHDLPKIFQCHMCEPRDLAWSKDVIADRNQTTTWRSRRIKETPETTATAWQHLLYLRKFLHADEVHENEDPEEFLLNPESLPFNLEIDKTLSPYRHVLHTLMFSPETVDSSSIPAKAWLDIQKKKPPCLGMPASVDVDMEALCILEDRMFDRSEDAGIAGNFQWGLDVGMHQDNWCPWKFGGENGKGVREGTESELESLHLLTPNSLDQTLMKMNGRSGSEQEKKTMKHKEILEPETAEHLLQDGSAKVIGHPAK
ncbi:hypothetical protein IW261DRAFT_1420054 [Armillaria novae-zelandiae]|uniref:Zinc finger PHD-type domain-containing protein n=1 Tax=Armillaria novae-zelandiae TaxID=153914 RepID=A0AA39P8Q6_9AGAR|nr:hypothetical protein IW261DRAFT_1420054 [Armillaria novae-zelandiae]